ncbi:MAG: HAMP domain-containing protein [Spirochaetales bacterium]|jgi:signal transduction histidine kinase|nr:HAMP domain-containing protein [Spirochaetales bacterium]
MRQDLKGQLILTIMFIVLGMLGLSLFLSHALIGRKFRDYIVEEEQRKTRNIAASLSQYYTALTRRWDTDLVHAVGMYALYDGYIIKVFDINGLPVWDAENHDMTLCYQIMAEISERMQKRYPQIDGKFISHDYGITQDGRKVGSVTIRYFGPYFLSESDFRFLDALNGSLLAAGLVSLAFAIAAGVFLARRIARPISAVIHITRQISQGNYAIRFEGRTRTQELDELVSAVNHLAGSLSEQENLRKRLTSDIAHELRTPLTTMGAHLEAMIEGVWQPTPERLQSCHEEAVRLGKLVADLERLEREESGSLKLNKTPVDLLELLRSVSANLEIDMRGKGLRCTVEGEPAGVFADRDRISQVAVNLLSNALKYTPENGHIRLSVKDSVKTAAFTVSNSGAGIPADELPFIFERFYRADKSRNRKTGGAGIGLAIVKSIVMAHGGTVNVESRPGQGSSFTVTLPK